MSTEQSKRNNVSTSRVHKARTLQAKRLKATEHGIKIHEDLIVIEYPDGYVQYQRWDGDSWKILKIGVDTTKSRP